MDEVAENLNSLQEKLILVTDSYYHQLRSMEDTGRLLKKNKATLRRKKSYIASHQFAAYISDFANSKLMVSLICFCLSLATGFFSLIICDVFFNWPAIGVVCGFLMGLLLSITYMAYAAEAKVKVAKIEKECIRLEEGLDLASAEYSELENELVLIKRKKRLLEDKVWAITSSQKHKFMQSAYRLQLIDIHNLSGKDFEEYLKKVFEHLGAYVKDMPHSGDQGADLIVEFGSIRICIQAKRKKSRVSNSAVQQAHAGKDFNQCDYSAVITNNEFTRSAKQLASRLNCILIDGKKLNRLINGELSFPGLKKDAFYSR